MGSWITHRTFEKEQMEFTGKHFHNCFFKNAILQYSSFMHCSFESCTFSGVDFLGASLHNASFINCTFENVQGYVPIVPDHGEFIGWKRCQSRAGAPMIAELWIPQTAKRVSNAHRVCRASAVLTRNFYDFRMNVLEVSMAIFPETLVKGELTTAKHFTENRWYECGHGIEFRISFGEAVN